MTRWLRREETAQDPENAEGKKETVAFYDKGIHVQDGKSEVHVGLGYLRVKDENGDQVDLGRGHLSVNGEDKRVSHKSLWHLFPYPVLCVVVFLLWGFLYSGWAVAWTVFLTVPLYYTTVEAVLKRNPHIFCYPALCALVFFLWGYYGNAWGLAWVVFLTVPVYYTLFGGIRKKNGFVFCYPAVVAMAYITIGLVWNAWHPWWILFLTIPIYYSVVEMVRATKKQRHK